MNQDPVGEQTLEVMSVATYYNNWLYKRCTPWLKGSVAEIGVGIGNFLPYYAQDNLKITALEFNREYISRLRKSHRLLEVTFFDLQTQKVPSTLVGRFDTAISLNVFEHVPDISLAFKNATALLKPGGNLIILVPAFQWAYSDIDKQLGHIKRYTTAELKHLGESQGLRVEKSFYTNPLGLMGWLVAGKVFKQQVLKKNQVKAFDIFAPVLLKLEMVLKPPVGLSAVCVFKKP